MTKTLTFEEAAALPRGQLKDWAYNAADCTGTLEIANILLPRVEASRRIAATYAAERAFQNPAFAIMRRGILVDKARRTEVLKGLQADVQEALYAADAHPLVQKVWDGTEMETGLCGSSTRKDGRHKWEKWEKGTDEGGRSCLTCGAKRLKREPFNANSSDHAKHLFADLLKVPPSVMRDRKGAFSADKEVIARIKDKYVKYASLCEIILNVRDLKKQIGEVNAPLDQNGRYRTSLNIGATWTGRSSSSKNPMGLGGNTQNVAERRRIMFIADPGYEMANADLMRAESMVVAYLAEDEGYIKAHLTDTHTFVCRMLWPELPWTGDIEKDKGIASAHYFDWDKAPGHNARFQAKRIQHGSNYGLSPNGIAVIAKIPRKAATEAWERYMDAFPGIRNVFQARVRERIQQQLPLVTPLGREIQLFGRPWDEGTYKQGYAAVPQSTVADLVNIAMTRLWHAHDPHDLQLLQNGYDAILLQWRPSFRERGIQAVVSAMEIPILIGSRTCVVPAEVSVGKNWGKWHVEKNPGGQRGVWP